MLSRKLETALYNAVDLIEGNPTRIQLYENFRHASSNFVMMPAESGGGMGTQFTKSSTIWKGFLSKVHGVKEVQTIRD